MLCLFVRSFSDTPDATFSEEFLSLLMLGLVRSFSYTPLLVLVRFSYISGASFGEECIGLHASFSEEFLVHSSC